MMMMKVKERFKNMLGPCGVVLIETKPLFILWQELCLSINWHLLKLNFSRTLGSTEMASGIMNVSVGGRNS
jgi:hypothetical protein